ncbi:nitrate/nitrite transporter [Aquisalimonas sp.]|uniref:MFS transporter n=1 Tax=Aquisalimonas sp. TaxID=1872621 RepID=UPI0025BEA93D|nr:nitrate/nitrite transporter [Aquisalimonas sp.]
MATQRYKQYSVLSVNTFAFTMMFMVWTMFGEIGVPIQEELGLSNTQFGILTSLPILTGSLVRLPLGAWTDRYGGRPVFFILMLCVLPAVWLVQFATEYWQLLIIGAFVGLAGGSFSVGISYTAKWFERDRQGFAMGIFGAGNAGAAVTKYLAPTIIVVISWQAVANIYAAIVAITAIVFWFFTYTEPQLKEKSEAPSLREQLKVLNDPKVWKYCQYYSVVFGGYVGVSLYLTRYYMLEYGVGIQLAALIATIFVLPSGVIRAFGGYLSDKWGAHTVTWVCMWASLISFFFMSYPATDYTIHGVGDRTIEFHFAMPVWLFTTLLFIVGIAWGIGKASVFKYLSDEYDKNLGLVSGMVGLFGGLGGFLLPPMFGALIDFTGVTTSIWMLCFGFTLVSVIWMWWTERRQPILTRDRYHQPTVREGEQGA